MGMLSLLYAILCLQFLNFYLVHSLPLCNPDEKLALLQFKNSFSINESLSDNSCDQSYPKTLSWRNRNGKEDCCSWDGITCDAISSHVIGVDLSCSWIQGKFHLNSTLFRLSHLQTLNLAFNDFSWSQISPEFGEFVELTHLNLSNSRFLGQIPLQISQLSNLISLDLSSLYPDFNYLSFEPFTLKALVQNLTHINTLVLDQSDLSTIQLSSLVTNLSSSLVSLSLQGCSLHGNLANYNLFSMPKLQKLRLAENYNLIGSLSNSNMSHSSLRSLDLSSTSFYGELPNSIGQLKLLTYLDLSDCEFNGSIPASLENLTQLSYLDLSTRQPSYLDLSGWKFNGAIPTSLGNLRQLSYLDLSGCEFNGAIPASLGNLTQLSYLDLSGCEFNGAIPASLGNLTQLSYLNLSGCEFIGSIPASLGNLTQLSHLDMSRCEFNGSILASLGNLTQLTVLDLSANNFSGFIPSFISNFQNLVTLYLNKNNFNGRIPDCWGNFKKLEKIDFSSNNLEGELPISLFELTQLSNIDFSSNRLVGIIPNNTQKSSKLNSLYFSRNLLNGTIPSWCFSLSSLEFVDLSSNQFTGHISEISSYSLKHLDLYSNKLSGPLPKSISDLQNLSGLYLSSNNLSGFVDLAMFPQNLNYLQLSGNSLLTFSLDSNNHSTLPDLHYLGLSSCNVGHIFPKFLKHFHNLEYLDLSNNSIQGKVPKWLGVVGKDSLYYLNLSHNSLTGIDHQIPWGNLTYLDLSSNLLQGELPLPPNSIQFFLVSNNLLTGNVSLSICNSRTLLVLSLSHNNFSGQIPQCFGNSNPDLHVLDLQNNSFYGTIPSKICRTQHSLVTLNLNGNQLEGTLPRSLAKCTQLVVVDVGNNRIKDTFPFWLGTLQELQVLVLQANKFHGDFGNSKANSSFPKLRIFDISNNNFTGILHATFFKYLKGMMHVDEGETAPQYIEPGIFVNQDFSSMNRDSVSLYQDSVSVSLDSVSVYQDSVSVYQDSVSVTIKGNIFELPKILTTFTTIDLSNNKFEGKIPKVIGELHALKGLNLSHNGFTGPLPKSMGSLSNLEWLDLSSNKLTGKIPVEFINLNYLQVLNLSGNQLVGCIPRARHFDTFSNDSYEGNPGLKACNLDHEKRLPPPSTVLLQHEQDDDDESGFGWKAVAIGYGCGALFGMAMGYCVISTGKPQWLARMIEGDQNHNKRVKRPRSNARGGRRTQGIVN